MVSKLLSYNVIPRLIIWTLSFLVGRTKSVRFWKALSITKCTSTLLIDIVMCTRPDICWITTKLSHHLSKLLQCHWVAVKQVLRYLKDVIDKELVYAKSDDGLMLV